MKRFHPRASGLSVALAVATLLAGGALVSATQALVVTAGFFGGAMIYGLDHYALPS